LESALSGNSFADILGGQYRGIPPPPQCVRRYVSEALV
jgi:hypothetical protein